MNRTIPASPAEVYDAWLDPATPGIPWDRSDCEKVLLDPKIDGMQGGPPASTQWRRPSRPVGTGEPDQLVPGVG